MGIIKGFGKVVGAVGNFLLEVAESSINDTINHDKFEEWPKDKRDSMKSLQKLVKQKRGKDA